MLISERIAALKRQLDARNQHLREYPTNSADPHAITAWCAKARELAYEEDSDETMG